MFSGSSSVTGAGLFRVSGRVQSLVLAFFNMLPNKRDQFTERVSTHA